MKKSELKDGMMVKMTGYDGLHTIVNKSIRYGCGLENIAINLSEYDEDLNLMGRWKEYTIEYIYDIPEIIFKYEKYEEMTIEEICKALGKNIKIVKGN